MIFTEGPSLLAILCRSCGDSGVVPEEGLEPTWYRYRQILSLVRLPFRHPGVIAIARGL